jgi:hypothetical protein
MILRLRRTQSSFRRLAILLGAVALMLRAVLAPGVMPDPAAAADGIFKLIICTGKGIEQRSAPSGGPSDRQHEGDLAPCPYSSAGLVATVLAVSLTLETPPPAGFAPAPAQRTSTPAVHRGPGARAPPRAA